MSEMQPKKHTQGEGIALSILICTTDTRVDTFFPKMMAMLKPQLKDSVEVLWLGDNKKRSVGKKRNDLLSLAQGKYVVFVDDDDRITNEYVGSLLNGIKAGSDVVTFKVMCSVNGGVHKEVIYDARFSRDENLPNGYRRIPNHIMCIKRELALRAGFPEISMGEDDAFAKKLKPLLKSQATINKVLYYYDFSHQTSETQ